MFQHHSTPGTDRQFRTDRRAVSEVIGAILIFGLVVMLLVLIQVNAVPAANKQVEFEHNQRVDHDFQTLQGELYQVGTTGDPASATVETGVVYPNRFFLLNPGPAIGTLRTGESQAVTIRNARADGNPGDYWDGTPVSFTTRSLIYTPNYNELRNPGTTYWEHSMLFSRYDNDNVYFGDPTTFIDGRQIRLTLVDGSLSSGSLSTSVELTPVSTGSRTLSVDGVGDPITFTLRTSLSESHWREVLEGEEYASVAEYDSNAETVTIALDDEQRYDLRISKIRVGSSSAQDQTARYLTDVAGNETSVPEGSVQRLVVEVRDEFNNPVSNVDVTGTIGAGGSGAVQPVGTSRSDSDGRVTFRYDAPANVDGPQEVRVETAIGASPVSGDPSQRATFSLVVIDSDGSGSAERNESSDINPFGPETVQLEDAVIVEEDRGQPSDDVDVIHLTFKNTYESRDVDISRARLVMYMPRNQKGTGLARTPPAKAILYDTGESVTTGYDLLRGEEYATISVANPLETLGQGGDQQTYAFEMIDDDGESYPPVQGEMFTLTVEFDTGDRITYLITPR